MAMNVSQNQRGVSIIAVVATMLILSVMGVVLVTMVTTGSDISVNQLRSEQSFNIASGGVEYGLYTTTRGGGSWGEFTFLNRPLGAGAFTMRTNTSIDIVSLERRMTLDSTGSVSSPDLTAARMVRAVVRRGASGATILSEPFPSVPSDASPPTNGCAASPALSWCYSYTNNQGSSLYDGTQNAPGSTGGSLLARTTGANNARLTGYRQRTLATIAANTQVTLNLWYRKNRAGGVPPTMIMTVNLVATDGTIYPLWSDAGTSDVAWAQANVNWTVPATKTIDRIRLSLDLQDRATGAGLLSVWFDEVSLTTGTGTIPVSIINWQEVYQ